MVKAQLAQEIDAQFLVRYIDDNDWWLEQKVDGIRILAASLGARWSDEGLLNRNGTPTDKAPGGLWLELFTGPPDNCPMVLDGEWVDGVYWVFDILESRSVDFGACYPFLTRRNWLEEHLRTSAHVKLLPCAKTPEDKAMLALTALREGAEGVMLKHIGALYKPGRRSDYTLKVKFTKRLDAVVTQVGLDDKNNAEVSLVAGTRLVPVGRCSLNGKPHVDPGDVVELEYLYTSDDSRLVQPRLIRVRDDKTPKECDFGQLQYTKRNIILPNA